MSPKDEPNLDSDPLGLEPEEESPNLHQSRLSRLARRMLNRKELAEDTRELLTAVAETSDWAKSEAVRLVAREVRIYLEELKLKDDLMELARSHSLEVQMSLSLKPLADAVDEDEDTGSR